MLKLKPGVKLNKITPPITVAISVVAAIFEKYGVDCVITSANDGKHSTNSKHYSGNAIDLRTRDLPEVDKEKITGDIQEALNGARNNYQGEYDVVLESTHIHLEYDPQ